MHLNAMECLKEVSDTTPMRIENHVTNFKGQLYMWSCEGVKYLKSCDNHGVCAQDSDRKSPLQKHEELDK